MTRKIILDRNTEGRKRKWNPGEQLMDGIRRSMISVEYIKEEEDRC